MRIEILLFIITALIVANIYTEGKYLKKMFFFKKYYQMAGVVMGALILYWLIKKDPKNAKNILVTSNEYLKYMPLDRSSSAMLSPILDFTSKHSYSGGSGVAPTTTAWKMDMDNRFCKFLHRKKNSPLV